MFVLTLSSLTTSQSAGSSHDHLISMGMGSIGQLLKVVLSLLFSFLFLGIHKNNLFWFEKPTKSLVVVSESLVNQPTDRYSFVLIFMKCRFLHDYQVTGKNVDWIWCSYLLVFPMSTSFYVSSVRTGTISHLSHSLSIGLPHWLGSHPSSNPVRRVFHPQLLPRSRSIQMTTLGTCFEESGISILVWGPGQ